MERKCKNCKTITQIPDDGSESDSVCRKRHSRLPSTPINDGSTSAAVGLIGGAALGASLGGPAGAIIGGIVGGILGKQSKGVG